MLQAHRLRVSWRQIPNGVPLASGLSGFWRGCAGDVLTLSKWTAGAVPARHKPRHPTMRPRDAIAPAPKVGVVAAAITDRPRQHAHPALHLSASLLSPRLNSGTARGSGGRARSGDRPIGEGG